jgi:hypothetical protein
LFFFRLGLQELAGVKHEKGWQLYRLVFISLQERRVMPTRLDLEKLRAESAEARAERAEDELARLRKRGR